MYNTITVFSHGRLLRKADGDVLTREPQIGSGFEIDGTKYTIERIFKIEGENGMNLYIDMKPKDQKPIG